MFVGSWIGLIHLIASIFALVFGSWVLVAEKGTPFHRKIGYLYAISMALLIITALMIYRLFGMFGIFHIAALVSLITLACGMIPAVLRKPEKSWLNWHFISMYWSVMGLYAAFVAEILTRVPQTKFFWMVGLATFGVMAIANVIFRIYHKKWEKLAAVYTENDTVSSDKPIAAN